MFERFTDRARRVVVLSQEVARRGGAQEVTSGHLLHALCVEVEGVAGQLLAELGLDAKLLEDELTRLVGSTQMSNGHIPFTAEAKRMLQLSLREALQFGHTYIGTEHLLLALTSAGMLGEFGATLLWEFNLPPLQVRAAVNMKLAQHSPARPTKGPAPCICEHALAHHVVPTLGDDAGPCEWRGCGCPRWIEGT